jgi:hypothetical protein
LSHHQPDQFDRCVRIAGRPVCRRCLVLYPLAFVVAGVSFAASPWPDRFEPWLLALLPLPAVIEFCGEQSGRLAYARRRQIVVTVPLAVALGLGFARYIDDPTDLAFWAMVLVYGGACFGFLGWRLLDEHAL